jgi:hypothetical protein
MRFSQHAVAMTILAVLLVSCSSTTLTKSWKDPAYRGQIRKVYIVGVTKLDINRYDFEDVFSQKLQAQGVGAIASYKDSDIPVDIDEQMIIERALAKGADSVLMARLVGKYGRHYEVNYQPATATDYQVAVLEATLYDVGTGKQIWSSQLETVFDRRIEFLFDDFAKAVIGDLRKQGLL